ncbi:MAG: MMPL family transporter [Bacteroidales bacterium]|nr:MMPL family transporter [Bacteroidales bacterium]
MWTILVRIILRNRPFILIAIALITIFMGWKATSVKMSYDMARMLPTSDSGYQAYENFKKQYGEDGNVLVIGVINPKMFELKELNYWFDLAEDIKKIDGIQEVASITRAVSVIKNDSLKKFEFVPVLKNRLSTQAEADSLKEKILALKFYEGLLYNPKTNAYLLAVTLDKKRLNDKSRLVLVDKINSMALAYKAKTGHELHLSGLPFIRSSMMVKIKNELILFIFLSIGVAAFILFLFFRSLKVVASSLVVVSISILWAVGLIALFGFKITILTGVIPSLTVIIAIENCIYILNKYHWEYRLHGNQIKALSKVVQRIGFASLMVNTATAIGFATFILVSNQMLREFGIITAISIMLEYVLCITVLPIIFSYLAPPSEKHVAHLDNKIFSALLDWIIKVIQTKRKMVYIIAGGLLLVGIVGLLQMRTSGKVVDDLRKTDPIFTDLKFFEKHFGGVMPFEIAIDTQKKKGVMRLSTIQKIDELQDSVLSFGIFSKPLSVAELVKFARQAYFNGNPDYYSLPNSQEKNFVLSYFPTKTEGKVAVLHSFIDSTQQKTRVSFQMADVGTKEMNRILARLRPAVDSIFNPEQYKVTITGNSVVYVRGTEFLIDHLFQSVLIAIISISLLLALLFSSFRMIVVSMLPNIIPLIITAAIMGFTGVPIKPSTIIVFSIALGISVDNAIQYLSRYRHELKKTGNDIGKSALNALREAGFSMIYTSIVLVLGFSVFMVSGFGGTQALGMLVSTTLFIAMFFNMVVLPSLLLSLDKMVVTKAFESEPLIEIYDGDENNSVSNSDDTPNNS